MTAPATPLYVDIYSVKLIAAQHGSHFFDPEAMRFFRSRTSREAIYHDGKYYFVTSEQFETWYPAYHREPRMYTARIYDPHSDTRNMIDIGDFQQFNSSAAAWNAIKRHIKQTTQD